MMYESFLMGTDICDCAAPRSWTDEWTRNTLVLSPDSRNFLYVSLFWYLLLLYFFIVISDRTTRRLRVALVGVVASPSRSVEGRSYAAAPVLGKNR